MGNNEVMIPLAIQEVQSQEPEGEAGGIERNDVKKYKVDISQAIIEVFNQGIYHQPNLKSSKKNSTSLRNRVGR